MFAQGWFYRELRQSLVDMEDLFNLLKTPSRLPDGTQPLPDAPPPAAAAPAGQGLQGSSSNGSGASSSATSSNGSSHSTAQQRERQWDEEEQRRAEERRSSNGAASSSRGLRLELRDVHFSYPSGGAGGGGRQVLRGVSLAAEPGESIAVVGE